MRSSLVFAMLVLVSACTDERSTPAGPDLQRTRASSGPQSVAGRYIVVFYDDVEDDPTSVMAARSIAADHVYRHALRGFAAQLSQADLLALRSDPRVKYVEADQTLTITDTQTPTPSWGLDRIDMRNLPLDDSYTFNTTGAGVNFYGIDTGIRTTHEDFTGRTAPGFTSINDGNGTDDCNGHGTHTASTAAGTTYGVAKGMTVVPVRVLNCSGSGSTSGVIAGIDWVTDNANLPAVANMSLGGGANQALDDAVAGSVSAGVVYSVSAGGSNASACLFSPAREPTAITIGATDISDQRASFSNFGSCVDLFGPGVSIVAAWNTSNTASRTLSGTSMSAPHVAGVAGLFLQANPAATPAQVGSALTSNATEDVVGNPGAGSPNLMLYMGFIGGTNQPPMATFTSTCDNTLTCTLDGSGSTDDQGIVSYEWTVTSLGLVVGTGPTLTGTAPAPWTGDMTLTVTDGGGLSDSFTQLVDITPPVASFTWTCDTSRFCVLDGTGSTDDQAIASYEWTVVGPGTVIGTDPVISGTAPGPWIGQITLTVTDTGGITGSATETIVIN